MSSNITPADLAGFREGYRADPMRQAMTRVLYTTKILLSSISNLC